MNGSTALVVSVDGLVKQFGNLRALDGLELEVRAMRLQAPDPNVGIAQQKGIRRRES